MPLKGVYNEGRWSGTGGPAYHPGRGDLGDKFGRQNTRNGTYAGRIKRYIQPTEEAWSKKFKVEERFYKAYVPKYWQKIQERKKKLRR